MVSPGLIMAIALALVHGLTSRLPIFSIIPRYRWTSFAGGVSLCFVFLEIFPELSHAQDKLQQTDLQLLHYLENHSYLVALIGMLTFYGLESFALRFKSSQHSSPEKESNRSAVFWIHISSFVILNVIFGYLLQDVSEHSITTCLLFFVALALHFFIIDENLREHHQSLYDKGGRWLLAGAVLLGAVIGKAAHLHEAVIAIAWSFSAGSIILNVLLRELPKEKEACFWSLVVGCTVYGVLLLGK